jgi:hypothetical protein
MDSTVQKIIQEVADEKGINPGFIVRIIEIEMGKAHMSRRHGLFDDIRKISRQQAIQQLEKVASKEDKIDED